MTPNKIVVHCAATPEGGWYVADDIDRWHRARGWNGIGYHAVVLLDGQVEVGRPEHQQGAHVARHNSNSLGVCYIGGVAEDGRTPKDTRTVDQREAIRAVVLDWMSRYQIPVANVFGHYELDSRKACPSFDMSDFRADLSDTNVMMSNKGALHVDSLEQLPQIGGSYVGSYTSRAMAPTNISQSIVDLQGILGVKQDGWIGPITYGAIRSLVVGSGK